MKKHMALTTMAVLALGLAACDDKETTKTEETSETTDVNGTVVETNSTSESTVHEDGTESHESETKTTVDPEGMMNKETVEEIKTEEKSE